MLRKMFDDEVLKEYSYVGQKKKKNIFSTLISCSVIFGKCKYKYDTYIILIDYTYLIYIVDILCRKESTPPMASTPVMASNFYFICK